MLKVTHKVRVPFTVGDYVDEVECDVLPLEVCGLLLGRPWQYDRPRYTTLAASSKLMISSMSGHFRGLQSPVFGSREKTLLTCI